MYIPFPPTDPGIKFPNFDIFFLSFDNLSFLFNNRDVFGIFRANFISGKNRLTTQQKDNTKMSYSLISSPNTDFLLLQQSKLSPIDVNWHTRQFNRGSFIGSSECKTAMQ